MMDRHNISILTGAQPTGLAFLTSLTHLWIAASDCIRPWQLTKLFVPILLFYFISKLWRLYVGHKDPECPFPLPPGNMGWPLVGESLAFIVQGAKFFRDRSTSYGSIYKTHLLGQSTIRVSGAENVRAIIEGEGTLVATQWPPSCRLILGEGALAQSTGDMHHWRKSTIMHAFQPEALRSYVPQIQVLLGFDVDEIQKCRMLVLFEDMLSTLFTMSLPIPGIGLYRGLNARRQIMAEIQRCVERHQATEGGTDYKDALSRILQVARQQDTYHLDEKQIQDSALEMLFAGHLPTSSAVCSLLMFLGDNPKVYDRLTVELWDAGILDPVLTPEVSCDAIESIEYVDAVVREVLRLRPPVGGGYRKALKTFELNGCQIPKGWTIIYSIRETHNTSSEYEDREQFKPERWLPPCTQTPSNPQVVADEISKPAEGGNKSFNYIPFGGGKRRCVGQSFVELFLKIVTIELVRHANFRLENSRPEMVDMPVPHPRDNLPLVIRESPTELRRRAFTMTW